MSDSDPGVGGAAAEPDSLGWIFSLLADSSPWTVEHAMTQLLAHQNAEGFGPSLTDAMQDDALLIRELGRRQTPAAVAALRAFQAMSTIDTQRELARVNADRLARQGVPEPPWAATIGRVRVDGCWWAHDQFDETAYVLCAFSYNGTDEHGILAIVDRVINGGVVRGVACPRSGPWLDVLRRCDDVDDSFVVEPLDPAYARRLLEDAIGTSDRPSHPTTSTTQEWDGYFRMRLMRGSPGPRPNAAYPATPPSVSNRPQPERALSSGADVDDS